MVLDIGVIVSELVAYVKAFPVGFEPTTCRLEGGCSIRLGYGNKQEGLNRGTGYPYIDLPSFLGGLKEDPPQ